MGWPGVKTLLPLSVHPDTSALMSYFWEIDQPWKVSNGPVIRLTATTGFTGWGADLRYAAGRLEGQGGPFTDVVNDNPKPTHVVATPIDCPTKGG